MKTLTPAICGLSFLLAFVANAQTFVNVNCVASNHQDQFTLVVSDNTSTLVWSNDPQNPLSGDLESPADSTNEMRIDFPQFGCGRGMTLDYAPFNKTATIEVLSNYGCDGGSPETLACTNN